MVSVGNVRAGQILAVVPTAADYYEFRFGFGTGFIDKGHLEPVQGSAAGGGPFGILINR